MVNSILLFGDDWGLPIALRHIPIKVVCGLVCPSNRPSQHNKLHNLASNYGLPLLIQPKDAGHEYQEFLQKVMSLRPDLIFVHSYSMLLRPEILAIPRLGGVNVHHAILPQYRGANPIQWAIINGETKTGVTMHYMEATFDTGDIIAQREVPIYIEDTWLHIRSRIACAVALLLTEELPKLLQGENNRVPQDETVAHHWNRRHPEDGLIDWSNSVINIYNLIRALVKPHPGAFYFTKSGKVVLDDYRAVPQVISLKYGFEGGGTLQSARIALVPISLDDLPVLYEWINDWNQVLMNKPYSPIHEGKHRDWFDAMHQRNDVINFGIRPIKTEDSSPAPVIGPLIGTCQLHSINYVHRSAELQIRIGDISAQGMGYGTEATRLLLDFAFRDLNLHRVSLHVFANNERAIRMYEKIGFVGEGVMRKMAHIDGVYIDALLMGILREEYKNV